MSWNDGRIAIFLLVSLEVQEYLGIEQVGEYITVGRLVPDLDFQFFAGFREVGRRQRGSRPMVKPLHTCRIEDDLANLSRPSFLRTSQPSLHHIHHTLWKAELTLRVQDILSSQIVVDHEQGHVTDYFAGRCDLHNVTKDLVGLRIGGNDFPPSVAQTKAGGLLSEIRELPARHFMLIDLAAGRLQILFERIVVFAHIRPVVTKSIQVLQGHAGVVFGMLQGRHDRIEAGLAGHAAHRREGPVGDIQSGIGRAGYCPR